MSPSRQEAGERQEHAAFVQAAARIGVPVASDEPLANHCTFRIGGPADLYAAAIDIDTLEHLGELATEYDIPVTILGGGSNVLISDHGVRGLVVANKTREMRLSGPDSDQDETPAAGGGNGRPHATSNPHLVVDSGVAMAGLARWAIRGGLAGLEWAVSIPGTVGGAVIGNAGAHGGQIANNLGWALITQPGSGRRVMMASDMGFGYRDSILKRELASEKPAPIVLQAGFQLEAGNELEMAARADAFLAKRRATQPAEPSAGSVFRNPPGDYAGRLVEAVGLKGHRLGGVRISPRHANFIVNTGGGRAAEVAELIRVIKERVFEDTGIELMQEIVYLGDWTGTT
jgi:UDP-N-acetylmuramate dehydrogenase